MPFEQFTGYRNTAENSDESSPKLTELIIKINLSSEDEHFVEHSAKISAILSAEPDVLNVVFWGLHKSGGPNSCYNSVDSYFCAIPVKKNVDDHNDYVTYLLMERTESSDNIILSEVSVESDENISSIISDAVIGYDRDRLKYTDIDTAVEILKDVDSILNTTRELSKSVHTRTNDTRN